MVNSTGFKNKKKNTSVDISGSLLARNALLNLIGQAVPLIVGVVTIPFIVRGLGNERFGLLSLAWVILGYFSIFDLGLGRATTKFVAEALGKGEDEEVPYLVWTAVTSQAVLGIVGGLILAGITPLLVEKILNIPLKLLDEAKDTFYLLALSVPIVLLGSSFRGVLEAIQRFDLINTVRIPSSMLTYLLPLVGVFFNLRLTGIVTMILLARLGTLVSFLVLSLCLFSKLKKYSCSVAFFPKLISFGGWITVSSATAPVLLYLDRFLIGSLLTIAAVTYYMAPYEAVTRLSIISVSLTMTLFPAFSTLDGVKDRLKLGTLFSRSVKYVLLLLGPIVLVIALFAKEILQIWLGTDFAIKSMLVLQLLAFGVLINSLAHTPFALLQGIGRPDLPAKFHLLELPIYCGISWILIRNFGVAGAAVAWVLRVALDAFLLFGATFKVYRFSFRLLRDNGTILAGFALLIFTVITWGFKIFLNVLPLFAQALFIMALLVLFALIVWRNILDVSDRGIALKFIKFGKFSK